VQVALAEPAEHTASVQSRYNIAAAVEIYLGRDDLAELS
jgi:hypothetical protein